MYGSLYIFTIGCIIISLRSIAVSLMGKHYGISDGSRNCHKRGATDCLRGGLLHASVIPYIFHHFFLEKRGVAGVGPVASLISASGNVPYSYKD